MVEHHDPVDDAHQHPHDVLDPDDRDAELGADAPQHFRRLVHLRLVEPAEAFIGQQQGRAGGQRLGQFEFLEPGGAEPGHRRVAVGRQADQLQRPLGRLEGASARVPALAVIAGEHDVVEQRQAAERPGDLEGAADPLVDDAVRRSAGDLAPVKADRAGGRRQGAGEQVEDRALARAVWADQAEDFALIDLERDVVDRSEAAEALDQIR